MAVGSREAHSTVSGESSSCGAGVGLQPKAGRFKVVDMVIPVLRLPTVLGAG